MSRLDNIKRIQEEVGYKGCVLTYKHFNQDTLVNIIEAVNGMGISSNSGVILLLNEEQYKGLKLTLITFPNVRGIEFKNSFDYLMSELYSDGYAMVGEIELFYEKVEGIEHGLVITEGGSVETSILITKI